jgi:23S rRNA pseudouridine2605 synthase
VNSLAKLLEAALFASPRPIPAEELAALDPEVSVKEVRAALEELRLFFDDGGHGVELVEQGGGWQILTRPEYTEAIERARMAVRPQRLSGAALETLAIVAYRQPIGRAEIADIRGVDAGAILKSLLERALIEVVAISASCRAWMNSPSRCVGNRNRCERLVKAAGMRIHRALARAGVASRRKAEELVAAGRVKVNGVVARTGQTVNPTADSITVDGTKVSAPAAAVWAMLNKPTGVLTTRSDPGGRRTVFELVPAAPGLTYVGRLDYMTEGLLLMTTDGDAAHALTHPKTGVERTYVATVRGNAPNAVVSARKGVELEDGFVKPDRVEARPVGDRLWEFAISISEGKNREVRRLCEALGLEVLRLVRTRFGPLELGSLPPGSARPLTSRERKLVEAVARGTV